MQELFLSLQVKEEDGKLVYLVRKLGFQGVDRFESLGRFLDYLDEQKKYYSKIFLIFSSDVPYPIIVAFLELKREYPIEVVDKEGIEYVYKTFRGLERVEIKRGKPRPKRRLAKGKLYSQIRERIEKSRVISLIAKNIKEGKALEKQPFLSQEEMIKREKAVEKVIERRALRESREKVASREQKTSESAISPSDFLPKRPVSRTSLKSRSCFAVREGEVIEEEEFRKKIEEQRRKLQEKGRVVLKKAERKRERTFLKVLPRRSLEKAKKRAVYFRRTRGEQKGIEKREKEKKPSTVQPVVSGAVIGGVSKKPKSDHAWILPQGAFRSWMPSVR